jgi:hypothetical protein
MNQHKKRVRKMSIRKKLLFLDMQYEWHAVSDILKNLKILIA